VNNTLPTRTQVGDNLFQEIEHLLEAGHSQTLGREQALQVAAWALKIAGERELQHQVLIARCKERCWAELVELPENYG
jgi:hypothetical protein